MSNPFTNSDDVMEAIGLTKTPWQDITAIYPKKQMEVIEWKDPFKEGGNPDDIDIYFFRASTIYKGLPFTQVYRKILGINTIPNDIIKELITAMVDRNIKFYDSGPIYL